MWTTITNHLLGFMTADVKVGKRNHQKRENSDHKRRKTILHRSTLAKPNKLPRGRGKREQ